MDYEQLQQYKKLVLDRALLEGKRRNEEQFKIWSDYRERHEKVIEGVETFQRELAVDCMVPIGKRALMRGKLTRTNEILVSLGEGYFAKYSAVQAIALCNRRIKRANDILESLEKERRLYETRQSIPNDFDAFGGEERKDLIEHWDNEKLDNWRAEHRRREKEYRKKLSELRNTQKQEIQTEEDLFVKLDALELQEELEDELLRLESAHPDYYEKNIENGEEYEESDSESRSDTSNTTEDETDEDNDKKLLIDEKESPLHVTDISKTDSDSTATVKVEEREIREKKVVFGESQVKYFKNNEKIESISQCSIEAKAGTSSQGNSNDIEDANDDVEPDEDDVIRIDFKHSDYEPETIESEEYSIQSPGDIYRMLSKPKSILKNSPNHVTQLKSYEPPVDDSTDEGIEDNPVSSVSAYRTIVKEVRERLPDSYLVNAIEPDDRKQRTSKFKRQRATTKR